MRQEHRIEIAELMQMLEINKCRLDPRQYKEFEKEINRKIRELRKEEDEAT